MFFFQGANKQLSNLLGNDIAVQALNYHLSFIGCMNHAVLAFILSDVLAYATAVSGRLGLIPIVTMAFLSEV